MVIVLELEKYVENSVNSAEVTEMRLVLCLDSQGTKR